MRNKQREKKKRDPAAVLQSHPVGEIAACPGCIADMTFKMIEYVWNFERIHSCDCAAVSDGNASKVSQRQPRCPRKPNHLVFKNWATCSSKTKLASRLKLEYIVLRKQDTWSW